MAAATTLNITEGVTSVSSSFRLAPDALGGPPPPPPAAEEWEGLAAAVAAGVIKARPLPFPLPCPEVVPPPPPLTPVEGSKGEGLTRTEVR